MASPKSTAATSESKAPVGRGAVLARDLLALTPLGKVELCVWQNAAVEQKLSREADARFVAPLLAKIAPAPAAEWRGP